jgi:hypothetical protein
MVHQGSKKLPNLSGLTHQALKTAQGHQEWLKELQKTIWVQGMPVK